MTFTNYWDSSGASGGTPAPIEPIPGDVFALHGPTTTPVAYNMPAGVSALQTFYSWPLSGTVALGDDGNLYICYTAEGAGGDFTLLQENLTPNDPWVGLYTSVAGAAYSPSQGYINESGSVTVQSGGGISNNYPDESVNPLISNEMQFYAYGNLAVYNVNGEAQGFINGRYSDGVRQWYYASNQTWTNSPAATQNYQWTLDEGEFPVSLSSGYTIATCLSNNGKIYVADQIPGQNNTCSNWGKVGNATNDTPYKITDSDTGGSTVNFIDVVCNGCYAPPIPLFLARDDQNNLWGAVNGVDFQILDTDVVSIGPTASYANLDCPYLKSDGTVRWINTGDQTATDSSAEVQAIFDNGNFTGFPRFFCANEYIMVIIPQ
jgi:hypothetical protein